tara:strand:+ start:44851 stop:45003 length:153 start_codon:yes stop_codon:yes gene_type:complete
MNEMLRTPQKIEMKNLLTTITTRREKNNITSTIKRTLLQVFPIFIELRGK